jgi:hypothetical protein
MKKNLLKKYFIVSSFVFVGVCLLVAAAQIQKAQGYVGGF